MQFDNETESVGVILVGVISREFFISAYRKYRSHRFSGTVWRWPYVKTGTACGSGSFLSFLLTEPGFSFSSANLHLGPALVPR